MSLAIRAAVVVAVLPFVLLRGRALRNALATQAAVYVFALALWTYATTMHAAITEIDPWNAFALLFAIQTALVFLNHSTTQPLNHWRWAIAAALLYIAIIPAQQRTPIDGDEPYYLLVTESIVHDHDLDLRNQYANIAHTDTRRPDLIPQPGDPVGPHGEQYSRHEPFLPLLMAPGYALFGVQGAIGTIALFGILLVRSLVRFLEDEGVSDDAIRALMPLIVFGPPLVFYAVRIWPEVPAAFCFVEAIRGVRQGRGQRWIPALLALVLLKLRFLLVAVMLVPFVLRRTRSRALLPVLALILAVPMLVVWLASGSATNVHTWRELLPVLDPAPYLRGFFGLLLDGAAGIAFQAPLYLLGIFAFARWRDMPDGFRIGAIASSLYVLTLLPRAEWHGGWSPPLRYLVFCMPVLALGAATLWQQSRAARAWLAPIALWTIGLDAHGIPSPRDLFQLAGGENNAGGAWLSELWHTDFSRLFPSFIRPNLAATAAAIALVVAFLLVLSKRVRIAPPLVPAICTIAVAAFAHYGRLPGNRIEFEDAHVVHDGGELYPYEYQVARFLYRGGWILKRGDSLSFLAERGRYVLFYATTGRALVQVDGRAYELPAAPQYAMTLIDVPRSGRVRVRCLEGSVNLDRMDRRE
jgi:hypothetical protein